MIPGALDPGDPIDVKGLLLSFRLWIWRFIQGKAGGPL